MNDATRDLIHGTSKIDLMVAVLDLDLDRFTKVDGSKIHPSIYLPQAWCDGERVLFQNVSDGMRRRFFYYIGAENEAVIQWFDGENAVYGGLSEDRVDRIWDGDELTLQEALALSEEGGEE